MRLSLNYNFMAASAARNLAVQGGNLADSVRRLSSGLRVGQAADDAAGLAIRELMRADISALNQGVRNASDAISLLQTADGALSIIDEKLIRMKELAMQGATGTYSEEQRRIINDEFWAMGEEIQRIALSTDFNGIKLLDGSLSGAHDGSPLKSTGAVKVHFGSGNDSAEDYYYINLGDATLSALGIGVETGSAIASLQDKVTGSMQSFPSGIVSFALIPKGSRNVRLHLYDNGADDTMELFTTSGKHLVGTDPTVAQAGEDWYVHVNNRPNAIQDNVLTQSNAFRAGATYDKSQLNGSGGNLPYNSSGPYNQFTVNGMNIQYSGSGNTASTNWYDEYLVIDEATEDLVLLSVGSGVFNLQGTWDFMPKLQTDQMDIPISVSTQGASQEALERVNEAIVTKDTIRAHIGALQNRLENTISNLRIQGENLQAAESRISDMDVALEMTHFVREQILMQAGVSMLSQANGLHRGMVLSLLAS